MAEISPLRRRMIDDMMIRNLSPATQQSYLYAVAKFSRHFRRSPDRLGLEEVRAYQLHLIAQQRSWSHINQVVCALRFFYGITLGWTDALERIVANGHQPRRQFLAVSFPDLSAGIRAWRSRGQAVRYCSYCVGECFRFVVNCRASRLSNHRRSKRISLMPSALAIFHMEP